MIKSETITKIAVALLKAQKSMGNAVKDSKNPFFKSAYADLNAVREACMPALGENGISVLQATMTVDNKAVMRTTLLHESGEWLAADTDIVCSKQNDPQAYGSAVSYARRYGLQSLVCLGSVDDDAEAGMGRGTYTKSTTKLVVKEEPKVEVKQTAVVADVQATVENPTATSTTKVEPLKKPNFRKPKATKTTSTVEEQSNNGWD